MNVLVIRLHDDLGPQSVARFIEGLPFYKPGEALQYMVTQIDLSGMDPDDAKDTYDTLPPRWQSILSL